MSILRIQHLPGEGEPQFQLVRVKDGKSTKPASIRPPVGFHVEGRPDSDLIRELRWYLEEFLGYPFPPETEHAERVLAALKRWGRQVFDAVFDHRQGAEFLGEAREGGRYDKLNLQIASDDPRVLAWPWEALEDAQSGLLAQTCQIERRLNQVVDPPPIDERLPRDRVNILLVTARPMKGDVRYRSISRPLVELIAKHGLPAQVTVLRPPTFDQLQRHLSDHPHTYQVLHFDGHGGYGPEHTHHGGSHCFQTEGVLVFEDEDGKPDEITAEQLSNLLQEHAVPAVVLNACQSAMIDERAVDPFASVAAALLKSGMRSVVAMAYSLYVSGAREFVPAFYEQLFKTGDVARAVRAGRRQMYTEKGRICARGLFPLEDWLVPVVYQQDPLDFSFAAAGKAAVKPRESRLPAEARDAENPYGFVGRDGPLLELERAMLRPPAGILIQGLGGVGKTTLARGFAEWLEATGGLGAGCLWLDFREIRSAEFVVNRIGEALVGSHFPAAKMDEKLDALAAVLTKTRVVIVWDNFEVARGIEGTSVTANLTDGDRDILKTLLRKLRGGQSKVLITSRSREEWLGHENCYELSIGGLDGDERWEFCEAVLRDLNIQADRNQPEMVRLMDLLGGHPLAMRAILPRLKDHLPERLAAILRNNLNEQDLAQDEVGAKLVATLRFVGESVPEEQRPLLIPLGLHEGFVDASLLEHMARLVDNRLTGQVINRLAQTLSSAGLLRHRVDAIFELHPTLNGYLRSGILVRADAEIREAWAHAFVEVLGRLADILTSRALHEQRVPFHVHTANFHQAIAEAQRLNLHRPHRALLQSLGSYAMNIRDFASATRLLTLFAEMQQIHEGPGAAAAVCHQLGNVASLQRDFVAAETWYRKALAITEEHGIEGGTAKIYQQMGQIAQDRGDYAAAEECFHRSLVITERRGDIHLAAKTYHHLGIIGRLRRDFGTAEKWYRKALAVTEGVGGDQLDAAATYQELGALAFDLREFSTAEQWHRKSLNIKEGLGDELGAANDYHQLGMIAQEQRGFNSAEKWYHKALVNHEKLNNQHGAALAYHQLGMIAHERQDFALAERWYRKALEIHMRQGNGSSTAANTYAELGTISLDQRDFATASRWYGEALAIFDKQRNLHGVASVCHQFGVLALRQERFEESGTWFLRSIAGFLRCNGEHLAQQGVVNFMILRRDAPPQVRAKLETMWHDAGLGELPIVIEVDSVPPR